jgi:hypothetical protein
VAANNSLVERLRHRLRRRKGVTEKGMFGVGPLLNGGRCLGVWRDSLVWALRPFLSGPTPGSAPHPSRRRGGLSRMKSLYSSV